MNILILGGNGFIGYNLAKLLLTKQQKIIIYNRSRNSHRPELKGIKYIYGDFADTELLKKSLITIQKDYMLDINLQYATWWVLWDIIHDGLSAQCEMGYQ